MLTGQLPFVGSGTSAVLVQHRQTRPTLLRRFRPDAPRELSDLVSRLLAKQPFRRPQDLRSLIREFVELELILLSSEISEGD
jgi:serine/threonine protein kinase